MFRQERYSIQRILEQKNERALFATLVVLFEK
jgi:hypothetical protein